MQNAASNNYYNSLEFAVKKNSVMKSENKQIIYANTYNAFLFQSVKFIIDNFFRVDYAHWLIMKNLMKFHRLKIEQT